MNTKNDVTIVNVDDLDANREFFSALGFKIQEMNETQFMAIFNDKIFGIIKNPLQSNDGFRLKGKLKGKYGAPFGQGIEIWLSVDDVKSHHKNAVESGLDITLPFGNRGYGPVGDYGVSSPDGYMIFFSQPKRDVD